jgi:pyruvate dehydrogenase E2 component (dihydrolipoamide acetyltransferase)
MALSVVMPALEMAQETGKVVAWKKQEGELVKKGELLLEIETDKAVVEIEAAADGTLAGISAREGAVVPVGQTIAWLLAAGESIPQASSPVQTGRRTDAAPSHAAAATPTAPPPAPGIRISPKARRLAEQHGIDLSTIRGSGPGGEILADDILAASQAGGSKNAATSSAPGLSTIARLMAERTTQSWTSVPHIFLTRDVDATSLNAARTRLVPAIEKSHGVKLTHTDLLVVLVAQTLRAHPAMNASWVDGGIRNNADVHIGVAMAVSDGVVAPVIRDAASARLGDVALRRRDLADRARTGKLQPADLSAATFTISNLGMYEVDAFTAIIVPPQAGILAIGAIRDRVVAENGQPAVRPMLSVTLSADHRVVDGAKAAQFLKDLAAAVRDADRHLREQ